MAAVCAIDGCGVQAIGRCAECSDAFCQTHQARKAISSSESVPFVDLCTSCRSKRLQEAVDARDSHQQAVLRRLLAIEDRFERLIVTLQSCAQYAEADSSRKTHVHLRPESSKVAVEACPILADATHSIASKADLMKNPPWDGREIARWFAQRAAAAGVPTESQQTTVQQKGILGRTRSVSVSRAGWRLPWGANSYRRGDYNNPWADAFIYEDGTLDADEINGWGLVVIGRLLNLNADDVPNRTGT